jgi:hypothetical protein
MSSDCQPGHMTSVVSCHAFSLLCKIDDIQGGLSFQPQGH